MRRRLLLLCAVAATLGVPAPAPAGAAEPWVPDEEVLGTEHVRGELGLLKAALRQRSTPERPDPLVVRALGRIGSDRADTLGTLRSLLASPTVDAGTVWAAGISGQAALAPDLVALLDRAPNLRAATAEALGFLGDARVDGYLIPLLRSDDVATRVAACLALSRLPSDRGLEAVLDLMNAKEPEVEKAACVAAWRLAGARRKRLSTKDAPWDGDMALVGRLLGSTERFRAGEPQVASAGEPLATAETRIFAYRAINALLPKTVAMATLPGALRVRLVEGILDPDARVAADLVSRIGMAPEGKPLHDGDAVQLALEEALAHRDALVRETAAETCALRHDPALRPILSKRAQVERDGRVMEALAVALARCGDAEGARAALRLGTRADATRQRTTAMRLALAIDDEASRAEIDAATTPVGASTAFVTPIVALETLLDGLGDVEGPLPAKVARRLLAHPDLIVRASAASLLGEKGDASDLDGLGAAYDATPDRGGNDLRAAVVEALGKITKRTPAPADEKVGLRIQAALSRIRTALKDPAPTVRLAARAAAAELPPMSDLPEAKAELGDRNDWKGLPRPKAPVLGLDQTKGGPWLSEAEILALAKAIRAQDAGVVLKVKDLGEIRLALDAEACPVHAANLVLLAASGFYDGTTWHRVVPAFVIQGGDPRGDGSGDAGYSVPDEISTRSFTRGALGMPKNTKDTGGCQIFLMHGWAPHLDGKYTCFGEAVAGLDVIDRVRVGDVIESARVVAPIHAAAPASPAPTPDAPGR